MSELFGDKPFEAPVFVQMSPEVYADFLASFLTGERKAAFEKTVKEALSRTATRETNRPMNTNTLFLIRDLIAAVVNAINVHSNNPAHLAAAPADALKAKLADAGMPQAEQAHVDTVLEHLASLPAPVVPVPQAPVAPAAITVADFIAPPAPSESATPIDAMQEATAIEHA